MTATVNSHPCEIAIDSSGLNHLASYLEKWRDLYTAVVLISDEQVYALYGERAIKQLKDFSVHSVLFKNGEMAKTMDTAMDCWTRMQEFGVDRKAVVVSLGGGVVSDLAGFVASCYMRGIDLIHIPTTLLGMVDASIGGKNGINLPQGKNLIGTIHHPKLILIDPSLLGTLNQRQLKAGLAEVIKAAVIWDPELFTYLEQNMDFILKLQEEKIATIISQSCMIKAAVVRQDENDKGIRSILNYGHTFAHALETVTEYRQLLHGEAVAIGMSCAAYLSYQLGHVPFDFIHRQDHLIEKAGLSIKLPDIEIDQLIDHMVRDKKAEAGQISCILTQGIGKATKVNKIDKRQIKEALLAKKKAETL